MPTLAFQPNETVSILFEGTSVLVPSGITVAAAVMLAGSSHIRTTPISDEERAPFCHMGVCFECLVEIDGTPNMQGCLITVEDGMNIKRQLGAPKITSRQE